MKSSSVSPGHCKVCGSETTGQFYELLQMPINVGVQWSTRIEAQQCPKGDIRLALCRDCGFIWNVAFNPQLLNYTEMYDNSLHFSAYFQEYACLLATDLIEKYGLRNRDIIEIGCGNGDFLRLICALGNNRGVGFDTSYGGGRSGGSDSNQVVFIQDFYSEQYASYRADLICCRQVLEHIGDPVEFVVTVRRSIENWPAAVVFFEVPNVHYILRERSIWDIIYEHCSYFSPGSLARLFAECGFQIKRLSETYHGQYLAIEAVLAQDAGSIEHWNDVQTVRQVVGDFEEAFYRRVCGWQDALQKITEAGKCVVVWGGGARGVSFLNMLKISDQIQAVVDINPRKQGRYMPGTGHKIVSPESMVELQPDVVIIMNLVYEEEIRNTLTTLKISAEVLCA